MSYSDWTLSPKKVLSAFPKLPSSWTKYLPLGIGVLAFLGFLDAVYLTVLHYKNAIPPCTIAHGCETVLTSSYATIFGIPIALIGAGFYLTVLILLGIFLTYSSSNPATAGKSITSRFAGRDFFAFLKPLSIPSVSSTMTEGGCGLMGSKSWTIGGVEFTTMLSRCA